MKTQNFGHPEQRTPVLYSLVRLRPFAETEEFANVGVLVCCPSLNILDFRMQEPNVKRVLDFFERLDKAKYKADIDYYVDALQFIKKQSEHASKDEKRRVFEAFIHPREGSVRFSEYRVVMSLNPKEELNRLFEHYVRQNFSKDLQAERQQEIDVRNIIKKFGKRFVKQRIEASGVSADFPFVETRNNNVDKVIKPLYLGQETSNKIYAHGDAWVSKVRRIREALPEQTLFTIQGDMSKDPVRDIINELKLHRIIVEPYQNIGKIEMFITA
jgi:hypothetical protein